MGTIVVVAMLPVFGRAADLVQRVEHVTIQDLSAECTIESLDIGVRCRRFYPEFTDGRPIACCGSVHPGHTQAALASAFHSQRSVSHAND